MAVDDRHTRRIFSRTKTKNSEETRPGGFKSVKEGRQNDNQNRGKVEHAILFKSSS